MKKCYQDGRGSYNGPLQSTKEIDEELEAKREATRRKNYDACCECLKETGKLPDYMGRNEWEGLVARYGQNLGEN